MNNFKEVCRTIFKATRYSLAFCLRNSKWLTLTRLFLALLGTLFGYLAIQINGWVFNVVQAMMRNSRDRHVIASEFAFFRSELLLPIVCLTAIFLVTRFSDSYNGFIRGKWSQILRFANRRELQEHKATLDIARIRSKKYDDIERRIDELPNGWFTRIGFSEDMMSLLRTIFSFIIFGTSLIWYNPIYAAIIAVASLPMIIVEFRLNTMWWSLFQKLVPENKKRSVLERPYNGLVTFVQAIMFNQMPSLRKKIDLNTGGILESYEQVRKTALQKRFFSNTLTILGLVVVVAHASWSAIIRSGEIGTLTVIIGAARIFQNDLASIVSLVAEQWNSIKGIILIEEDFFGLKSVIKTDYPIIPPKDIVPEIKFQNVSFAYPDTEKLVLENVNFTIPAGSKTAIVGASGNGKSTLLSLLMRYYDPTSGSVTANGIDLKNIRPADWSNVVSALTQDYAVLDRLVGEEIASSRMDNPIDIVSVAASARFANFDSVVESDPQGYDSQIGTEFGGRDFSGGERQRLALARVHYRGTPVLVLDEPDAKLDAESAEKIINNVFSLDGVTVVLITHHVSRAERCDNVIVMGKGKIVEQGTHAELMVLNGTYVSMVKKDRERLLGGGSDS